MDKALRALAILLALTGPATSEQHVVDTETMALKLLFDECLRFVRDGTTPFVSSRTVPLSASDASDLYLTPAEGLSFVRFRDIGYLGVWGDYEGERLCHMSVVHLPDSAPPLSVSIDRAVDLIKARAEEEGFQTVDESNDSDGIEMNWTEAGAGPDQYVEIGFIFGRDATNGHQGIVTQLSANGSQPVLLN